MFENILQQTFSPYGSSLFAVSRVALPPTASAAKRRRSTCRIDRRTYKRPSHPIRMLLESYYRRTPRPPQCSLVGLPWGRSAPGPAWSVRKPPRLYPRPLAPWPKGRRRWCQELRKGGPGSPGLIPPHRRGRGTCSTVHLPFVQWGVMPLPLLHFFVGSIRYISLAL